MKILFVLALLIIPTFIGVVYGHTVDVVGEYRVEIGWMNEPVVSGETNGIEFYVSPLTPCTGTEPIKCAESQVFKNGIEGLEKTVKMKLIFKDESITLPLSPDHNVLGKYYAFVNPTVSGFYQANMLGTIKDTPISLSMHPPKVEDRAYIEFPEPSDITVQQMIDGHTELIEDVNDLKDSINAMETKQQLDVGYAGIIVGLIGVVLATIALSKLKKS